jgi:molybdate transport system regulatory protein
MDREEVKKRILAEAGEEQRLSCAKAFKIADELGCSAGQVGELCNELKVKIINCRLGCF